ncbi:MAG: hypothetical protein BWY72_02222 [Bacteroidetes bacterium ADurb.Bin416]|nr:MAG: hypothetical protein BWY72_02222 [Bacteroidetes bacterium ADurb.Bin416]
MGTFRIRITYGVDGTGTYQSGFFVQFVPEFLANSPGYLEGFFYDFGTYAVPWQYSDVQLHNDL